MLFESRAEDRKPHFRIVLIFLQIRCGREREYANRFAEEIRRFYCDLCYNNLVLWSFMFSSRLSPMYVKLVSSNLGKHCRMFFSQQGNTRPAKPYWADPAYILSLVATLSILIYATALAADAGSEASRQRAGITYQDNRLSAYLTDVPLQEVMQNLSDTLGIDIELNADGDRPVSTRFNGLPLEKGLKRLLHPLNYILFYRKNEKGREPRLARITVIDGEGHAQARSFASHRQPVPDRNTSESTLPQVSNSGVPSLEVLAEQLKNPDPDIRETALYDLFSEYENKALPFLEQALTGDGNDNVRTVAADLLSNLQSKESIAALGKGLSDADEDVRWAVVDALGSVGGRDVLPLLRTVLKDKNPGIREQAQELIDEIEEYVEDSDESQQ